MTKPTEHEKLWGSATHIPKYETHIWVPSENLSFGLLNKVAVGPKLWINRNLKAECTKTAIFQLLWPLDISKLVGRERAYTIIYYRIDLFFSRRNYVGNNLTRNRKQALQ